MPKRILSCHCARSLCYCLLESFGFAFPRTVFSTPVALLAQQNLPACDSGARVSRGLTRFSIHSWLRVVAATQVIFVLVYHHGAADDAVLWLGRYSNPVSALTRAQKIACNSTLYFFPHLRPHDSIGLIFCQFLLQKIITGLHNVNDLYLVHLSLQATDQRSKCESKSLLVLTYL